MARRPLSFWDGVGVGLIFVWIVVLGIAALASAHFTSDSPRVRGLIAIPVVLALVLVVLRIWLPASRFTIFIVGLAVTAICTALCWP